MSEILSAQACWYKQEPMSEESCDQEESPRQLDSVDDKATLPLQNQNNAPQEGCQKLPTNGDASAVQQDNLADVHELTEDEPDDDNDLDEDESREQGDSEIDPPEVASSIEQQDKKIDTTNLWTLPADKDVCTLEEIRRGQVINKTAPNECPVPGCGKMINQMRAEPSPGTISSGLRTHVLFVHYNLANRKSNKKRKLGWSNKRRSQPSPKKHFGTDTTISPSTSRMSVESSSATNLGLAMNSLLGGSNPILAHSNSSVSALMKKSKPIPPKPQSFQMSSLQNLVQANDSANLSNQQLKQKNQNTNASQNFNSTTSSLFSILAGLTQQKDTSSPQQPISRNVKTAHGMNTINISQCSRNHMTDTPPANSSLMSLLNENISGNVANSLKSSLNKFQKSEPKGKNHTNSALRQSLTSPANSYYHSKQNDSSYNNCSALLESLYPGNSEAMIPHDNSIPLDSFIESIAIRTGSNIGSAGISEVKKIIENITTSLICCSQTIADHLNPYGNDMNQQKPEISQSDIILAYKMIHKSNIPS